MTPVATETRDTADRERPRADAGPDYGQTHRDVYDLLYPPGADVQAAADAVAALCPPGGRVLELGVGHGRLALPMADRGLAVTGVDASPAMLDWLAERDPAGRVARVAGDFTTTVAGTGFDAVVVVTNTLFAVTSSEGQIEALRRAAEQVAHDGRVVVEAFDPSAAHGALPRHDVTHLPDGLMASTTVVDPARQLMTVVRSIVGADRTRRLHEQVRYTWPSELDLMARLAGLDPVSRNAGWSGEPFVAGSPRHVSVYRRVRGDQSSSS